MLQELRKTSDKVTIHLGYCKKDFADDEQLRRLEQPMFEVGKFLKNHMLPYYADVSELRLMSFMCPSLGGVRVQQISLDSPSEHRERYQRDDPADAGVILATEYLLQTYPIGPLQMTVTSVQQFCVENLEAQLRLLKSLRKTEALIKDRSKSVEDIEAKLRGYRVRLVTGGATL